MSKKATKKPGIQKDDILQAVVVMDSYNKNFMPACSCVATLPVVNRKLLDYSLEWLNSSSVGEVILFCSSNVTEIKKHVNSKTHLNIHVKILISEDCCSLGDVMRALDKYAVIRSTFILLTVDVIGNVNFTSALKKFKSIQDKDKGASMMILCKPVGKQRKDLENNTVIVSNSENRIISYQVQESKNIDIPMDILLEHDYIDLRNDLLQVGVAICSVAVPPLFSDNFDFQSLDDFIRGLLVSEEVMQGTVYYDTVKENEYLNKITNWPMYQIVSQDIIRRWTFPMVPDISEKYIYGKNSVYLKNVTICKNCKLISDVVIGNKTKLKENVYVDHSVIGDDCIIGENVHIENSYIFNNVIIEKNSVIKHSVIGENCLIKENCKLSENCILGPGVILGQNNELSKIFLASVEGSNRKSSVSENGSNYKHSMFDNSDSEDEEPPPCLITERNLQSENDDSLSESSFGSSADDHHERVMEEDEDIFLNEVVDSLTRGFEDKLKCENLILEINSSRYAYNIAVNDVNTNLIRAMLQIESSAVDSSNSLQFLQYTLSKLNHFMPLIENYIKTNDAQQDCLSAIEHYVNYHNATKSEEEYKTLLKILPKILHFFYDKNIIEEHEICSWHKKIEIHETQEALTSFITWLQEADEESDESSD
ncbi:translation initiation factor eIF2B subunit epsilon-like [Planococcus citri]|uniref:translation initiation factor eIF2B subunit epsilon-like n=1 Tax=Planococcus citri TaxID=170843 RepID=UPI0031F808A2